ncbi:MAG: hypothetical protein ACSHYB_13925 [Roseibacillus sp.]
MKTLLPRIASTILLFVLGSLLGWAFSAIKQVPSSQISEASTSSPTKSNNSPKSTILKQAPSPEYALLQSIFDSFDEPSRIHKAIALARTLPLSEAGKWLEQGLFSQREGYALIAFTQALKERWKKEDSTGYALWQIENGLSPTEQQMTVLADSDPELLLTRIRLLKKSDDKAKALCSLAGSRPDLTLAELAKLNPASLDKSAWFKGIFRNLVQKDRPALEAALEGLPSAFRAQAQAAIYREKLRENFKTTIVELQQEPDGLDILTDSGNTLSENRAGILAAFSGLPSAWQKKIANKHFALTYGMSHQEKLSTDWEALGFSSQQASKVRIDSFFQTIRDKKETVLEEFQAIQLTPEDKRYLIDRLGSTSDSELTEELLPHLDPKSQNAIAEKQVERDSRYVFQTYSNASELSQGLSQAEKNQSILLRNRLASWSQAERKQFLEDYQALQGEERQTLSTVIATSSSNSYLALETRSLAVEDIVKNSERFEQLDDKQKKEVGRNIFQIALDKFNVNPTTATAWVQELPEGDNRQYAINNLAAYWTDFEPDAARNWVNQLPATDRTAVLDHLKD